MSKKRASELKDTNISSKLLGANLQDINIEKFRDLTNVGKAKFDLQGKLTMPILKCVSNKFSPEIMFTITLPEQGLGSIDVLEECQNLVVLNVSGNSITSLSPLQKMKQLKFLNVGNNSISSIQPLRANTKLINAHLEGNSLKSLQSIKPLQSCDKLRNLYLQTISGNGQNGVCQVANYRNSIFQLLQSLRRLDGVTKGVELNNGLELVKKNKKEFKMELKNNGPFFTNKFPSVVSTYPALPGQNDLKKSIDGCRGALGALEIRIKAALAK